MARCRSCDAPVVWKRTEAGKAMPIDPDPVPGGNVVLLDDDRVHVLHADEAADDVPTYVSHFATCPNAKGHRRG
jgi:hypothetical protein